MQNTRTGFERLAIHFDQIQVSVIDSASGIFIGTNTQWNWTSTNKANAGFGFVDGEMNRIQNNINAVYDNDAIDAPVTRGDLLLHRR